MSRPLAVFAYDFDGTLAPGNMQEHAFIPDELGMNHADFWAEATALARQQRGDNILAYEMNGAPLPQPNGFPLRLIAPGWYGIANVKWLQRIEILDRPYKGRFMAPVPVGAKVHLGIKVLAVDEIPGGSQMTLTVRVADAGGLDDTTAVVITVQSSGPVDPFIFRNGRLISPAI